MSGVSYQRHLPCHIRISNFAGDRAEWVVWAEIPNRDAALAEDEDHRQSGG